MSGKLVTNILVRPHWNYEYDVAEYWEIKGKDCQITIERRPKYCDRGNFLAKIFPTGQLALDLDGQDGWPRYYFDVERAMLEIEAWLKKRKQWTDT